MNYLLMSKFGMKNNPQINFTKMHGLGNDFMIIETIRQKFIPTPQLIREWSDRHTGIGFDQLLLIEPATNPMADFNYRIFNADGNEVSQCGNGARCIALFLQAEKLTDKNIIVVETLKGKLELKIEKDRQVTVNMGIPNFDPKKIPFLADQEQLTYVINVENKNLETCVLSIGNPHCVLLVDDIKTAAVAALGSLLTKHPAFPEAVNVEFMQVINPQEIRLRVFERGVGETQACGSGACAAVIAGRALGLLNQQVIVKQARGNLRVAWQGKNEAVFLTGPAEKVFSGVVSTSL